MEKLNNFNFKISNIYLYLSYLIISIISLVLSITNVNATENEAYDTLDFSTKGSITITLEDQVNNQKLGGVDITIYKVADAINNNNNLSFNYLDSVRSCQKDLEQSNLTEEVINCVIESNLPSFKGTTDIQGTIRFNNLDLGLYLITQTNKLQDYSKINPFLVMIPEILDNKWNYNISASPKTDIVRLIDLTVQKVWNVSDDNIPNLVTIELLKENEVIDTVILNKEKNWTYTWKQIPESDEYIVREINIPIGYTATYRKEGNKFIVTNTKTLLQTGQNTWIITTLITSGILFILTGFILKRQTNHK